MLLPCGWQWTVLYTCIYFLRSAGGPRTLQEIDSKYTLLGGGTVHTQGARSAGISDPPPMSHCYSYIMHMQGSDRCMRLYLFNCSKSTCDPIDCVS